MAHTTRQQDGTARKQGPTGQTTTVEATQPIRRQHVRADASGQGNVAVKTMSQGRRVTAAEMPVKQPSVSVSGTHRDFRGKAFRALLQHDPVVARAIAELVSRGAVTGTRSQKISTRVDPGLMAAAKQRFGLTSESDVINASLAVAAAPDRFKEWLRNPEHTLTDDFELAV